MLIYDISVRSLVTESGIPENRKPSLVFGDRPTWDIRILDAGQPADLSGVTGWTAAVAEDLNPGTRPMCRTVSGISEAEGVVSVPLDAQTDTFAGATANRGPRVCLFELCGLDGDGGVALRVAFHVSCRMEADPGAVGDLVPIETTEMTSAQVQSIATGAAREEVAAIHGEIEQAAESAANSAETALGAASAAESAAQAAESAASTVPSPEGASPGDVPTVQEDGSVAYQPQQGGGVTDHSELTGRGAENQHPMGAITGLSEIVPDSATAQNQLADKDFVNSSINAIAAFPITRDAQKDPFRTRGELLNATTYYSGGEVRVPTRNDYAFVQSDEYYGTVVDGYTDFALTEEYVGYYVLDGYEKTLVTSANKDLLGIVPGTTVPYVELPSTRYIYNGTGFEFQFIVNQSGLTAAQWAALNSGITAEKVATYDGYATSKADLVNGTVPRGQLPVISESSSGIVTFKQNYGLQLINNYLLVLSATNKDINAKTNIRNPIVPSNLNYAVRSVSPLITDLPSDAASPIALTDASETTRNHSYIYTHTPDTAPTYQLPAVRDATIAHEIVLYLDLTSTASFSFTDSAGTTIAVDTNGVTPAIGETWVVWAEFSALKSKWIVRAMKETDAEVTA